MLTAHDQWNSLADPPSRAMSREGLERRRLALREAVALLRRPAVGHERLTLLQRTEDELTRVEAALRHPTLRAM